MAGERRLVIRNLVMLKLTLLVLMTVMWLLIGPLCVSMLMQSSIPGRLRLGTFGPCGAMLAVTMILLKWLCASTEGLICALSSSLMLASVMWCVKQCRALRNLLPFGTCPVTPNRLLTVLVRLQSAIPRLCLVSIAV